MAMRSSRAAKAKKQWAKQPQHDLEDLSTMVRDVFGVLSTVTVDLGHASLIAARRPNKSSSPTRSPAISTYRKRV
jgi:hypothetical protein